MMAVLFFVVGVAFLSTVQAQTDCLSCDDNNGGCLSDQVCNVQNISDYLEYDHRCPVQSFLCKGLPYFPCAIDDGECGEHSRCLTDSVTGNSICLESCYVNLGGCAIEEVCINEIVGHCPSGLGCSSAVKCLSLTEATQHCPPGHIKCDADRGEFCQVTCEIFLRGSSCWNTLYCRDGDSEDYCICPDGLVKFRDRCVDKRECYTLVQDPPGVYPLPIDKHSVLLELVTSEGNISAIDSYVLQEVRSSVRDVLESNGYGYVGITQHSSYRDGFTFHDILKLSGEKISYTNIDDIADLIRDHSHSLYIPFTQVYPVYTAVYPFVLSTGAKAGIAVAAIVVFLVLFIPVGVCVGIQMYREEEKKKAASASYSRLRQPGADDSGSMPVEPQSTEI